jgi:hypothetical protein
VLVIIHDRIVIIRTAKSQSYKAMGKKVFQQSKDAVLDIAWALCGTTPQEASPHVAT